MPWQFNENGDRNNKSRIAEAEGIGIGTAGVKFWEILFSSNEIVILTPGSCDICRRVEAKN